MPGAERQALATTLRQWRGRLSVLGVSVAAAILAVSMQYFPGEWATLLWLVSLLSFVAFLFACLIVASGPDRPWLEAIVMPAAIVLIVVTVFAVMIGLYPPGFSWGSGFE